MVDSIVTIAQNLDLHVVAEGVEKSEQIEILEQLNCQTIQGYYYSKPLSADEFTEFLEKQKKSNSQQSHPNLKIVANNKIWRNKNQSA